MCVCSCGPTGLRWLEAREHNAPEDTAGARDQLTTSVVCAAASSGQSRTQMTPDVHHKQATPTCTLSGPVREPWLFTSSYHFQVDHITREGIHWLQVPSGGRFIRSEYLYLWPLQVVCFLGRSTASAILQLWTRLSCARTLCEPSEDRFQGLWSSIPGIAEHKRNITHTQSLGPYKGVSLPSTLPVVLPLPAPHHNHHHSHWTFPKLSSNKEKEHTPHDTLA